MRTTKKMIFAICPKCKQQTSHICGGGADGTICHCDRCGATFDSSGIIDQDKIQGKEMEK